VEKKSTIPILSNIVIDAQKDQLELLATDLEVGIRTTCRGQVTKPGSVALSARRLYDIDALPSRRRGACQVGGEQLDSDHLPEGPLQESWDLSARSTSSSPRTLSRRTGILKRAFWQVICVQPALDST